MTINDKREPACIFCAIAAKKIPAAIVYETDDVIAFLDLHPKAQVHVLVVPKRHIISVHHAKQDQEDALLLGKLLLAAQQVAIAKQVQDGYQLLFNVGKRAGQTVDHVHLHVLGGEHLRAITE